MCLCIDVRIQLGAVFFSFRCPSRSFLLRKYIHINSQCAYVYNIKARDCFFPVCHDPFLLQNYKQILFIKCSCIDVRIELGTVFFLSFVRHGRFYCKNANTFYSQSVYI